MELYEKIHPEGWKDYPDTTTPIEGDNLTHIEEGIYENSVNIKKVNNVTKYITATAGADGDFYINIENDLQTGMVLYISFPTATNPASNARLSIDGASGTYVNIKNTRGVQILGALVQNSKETLVFNGTDFIRHASPVWRSILDLNIGASGASTTTFNQLQGCEEIECWFNAGAGERFTLRFINNLNSNVSSGIRWTSAALNNYITSIAFNFETGVLTTFAANNIKLERIAYK